MKSAITKLIPCLLIHLFTSNIEIFEKFAKPGFDGTETELSLRFRRPQPAAVSSPIFPAPHEANRSIVKKTQWNRSISIIKRKREKLRHPLNFPTSFISFRNESKKLYRWHDPRKMKLFPGTPLRRTGPS